MLLLPCYCWYITTPRIWRHSVRFFLHQNWLTDGKLYSSKLFFLAIHLQEGKDCDVSIYNRTYGNLQLPQIIVTALHSISALLTDKLCSLIIMLFFFFFAANILVYVLLERNTSKGRKMTQDYSQENCRKQIYVIIIIFN